MRQNTVDIGAVGTEQSEFREFSSLFANSGGYTVSLSLKTEKLVFRRPFLLRFFDVKNEEIKPTTLPIVGM